MKLIFSMSQVLGKEKNLIHSWNPTKISQTNSQIIQSIQEYQRKQDVRHISYDWIGNAFIKSASLGGPRQGLSIKYW